MSVYLKKICFALFAVVCVSALTGCTNWKKEYQNLDILYQNCEGQLELCNGNLEKLDAERQQLSQKLVQSQQTIDDFKRQLKAGATESEASGFGKGANVKYDAAAGTITVTLQNTVLFSSGKATLIKATISELDHINSVIRQRYSGMLIDVVGHTDSDPIKKSSWKDNWQLSAERALSVLRYLNSKGISSENIRAVAAGSSRPVASNKTAAGKAQNRRVEIVVHTRS
ncbi:MAG: OmpA family protein [Phycisphaerae bacterium]|nr:OmpA family protein [Phycisphaerae bacterium]